MQFHDRLPMGRAMNGPPDGKSKPAVRRAPQARTHSARPHVSRPQSLRGARRVEDDLVVVPKALEETHGSTFVLTLPRRKLQNVGQRSLPVNGAEQPVLERVDGENEI